jgi:opacity protein-like surface antigen
MKSKLSAAVLGTAMTFMAAGAVQAEGLLGQNYLGGYLALVQFGDDAMEEMFDDGTSLTAIGNINLRPHLDLQVGASYLWSDGDYMGFGVDMSSSAAEADMVWFFLPGERLNPYVKGGLRLVKNEVEIDVFGASEDESDVGFGGGGGLEFEASRDIVLRGGLDYFHVDSEDSINLSGYAGYWFNRQVVGFIGADYDFESENKAGKIGMAFRL